ncbi:MAG TPA: hypothetical protein PKC18_15270, partial [Lacipirellulaceae bacterium]|nr:hypothetical protein [Lacipirellulaceae bacterium]
MIGVVGDEATRAALARAAVQRNIPHAFEIGDIELALAAIDPDETADCVVIDLEATPDAVDDIAVLATGLPRD